MPRLTNALPKYRKHKASGQAVVTLDGRDFYLGPWRSRSSRAEYDRLIGEWIQNGRRLPACHREDDLTIAELCLAYWRFAGCYYVKNGRPTDELGCIKVALRFLRQSYGKTSASDFGPLALKAVRQKMIDAGHSRSYLNANVQRIKRMFRWGVENELVPITVHQTLATVAGLRKGKSAARETDPVEPVPLDVVEATLPHLPSVLADLVRFQLLTGCRPGEATSIRPCDVDRSGDVWRYHPASHKMEHKGRQRVVFIGPQAQDVLRPYLLRDAESYCFTRPRKPGTPFGRADYRNTLNRSCKRAGVEPWAPNRLRHAAATFIRSKFGLEAAQVTLGHASADVSQIYAERDLEKAADVMRRLG